MIQFARKLKGILEKAGKADSATVDALIAQARSQHRPLSELVVKQGLVSERELLALVGAAANIPPIDIDRVAVNTEILSDVPADQALEAPAPSRGRSASTKTG